VRLFISHAHRDADLAAAVVDVLDASFAVPAGELRCTSAPGYQLELGAMAPETLRVELGSAACVVALLTPNSLANGWVLFELGASWANVRTTIPLLAGGLQDRDIPGPLRGAAGGQLAVALTVDRMVAQLHKALGWKPRGGLAASGKRDALVELAKTKTFSLGSLDEELKASFAAKRARGGMKQGQVLDAITHKLRGRPYMQQEELQTLVGIQGAELYYRLENLRLMGFLTKLKVGEAHGDVLWGWTLSDGYRAEIGTAVGPS
jgi:hypothetical protein